MASFAALDPVAKIAWGKRLAKWRRQYQAGIEALDQLEQVFLSEPVQRDPAEHTWGTVYTARYDTRERSVRLLWPDDVWTVHMATAENGQRLRDTRVLMPLLLQREREIPHTPQVIFA